VLWNFGSGSLSRLTVAGKAVIPATAAASFRAVWRRDDGGYASIPAVSVTDGGLDGSGNTTVLIQWDANVPFSGVSLLWLWGQPTVQSSGGGQLGALLWDEQIASVLAFPGGEVQKPSISSLVVSGGDPGTLIVTLSEDCDLMPDFDASYFTLSGAAVSPGAFSLNAVAGSLVLPSQLELTFGVDLTGLSLWHLALADLSKGVRSLVSGRELLSLPGGVLAAGS
jgi:hypothetical protein